MALGEVFLAAFLQLLLDRLTPREILEYLGNFRGVGQKLEKWRTTLSTIGAVLSDAEERQLTEGGVKLWLDDLRDLAYDIEDMLDKFAVKMLKRMIEGRDQASTSRKVRRSFYKVKLSFDMNSEMKKITKRLQDISERKDKFGLKDTGTSVKESRSLPSSGVLDEKLVVGRDGDKGKIIELLKKSTDFGVVAIVGMPGVGKTTLAQLVFNHKNDAMKEFELKVWVSVSDDFNVVRVTKEILESITSRPVQVEGFSKMQHDLSEQLRGKKFLIVLDDIWNKDDSDLYDLWTRLQSPFGIGAGGSKIIVTTRDVNVAKIMGATGVHNLECMADGDCLEIFERHAFRGINNGKPVNYGLIKTRIVEKCRGLPLAARTLGGLLRCKEKDEWGEILNKLWNLADKSGILPVLKLSYHYLPSNLKRCFAYCSILPNDYEFGEKQLILLWMAEGLIQQKHDDNKQMEDLGRDYFRELLARSLFQESSKNNSRYVMHDLVNDLAQWAAGEICFRLEDKRGDNLPSTCFRRARHSSFIAGQFDGFTRFEAFPKAEHLRTFLPLSLSNSRVWHTYLPRKVTFELLPQLQYLRVLSFNGYKITELPESIGDLRLLQYLDLSYTYIASLPKSTSTLYHLQTLILEGCSQLKSLPANMSNLINLRHLNNSYASSLKGMPSQLGRLTNLQSLPLFVVSEGSDHSGIREIGPLLHLRGTLCLSGLENVTNVEDARRANLKCKERLDSLVLKWYYSSDTRETESAVLDMLQPHTKLKELTITGYAREEFSSWVGGPLFSNMVLVRLEECNNCLSLPPLGQLPRLKELYIRGMNAVESVGAEFYGECVMPFPLLEILKFVNMRHWKVWLPFQLDHGSGVFPCLKRLSIKECSKLEGKLPEKLDLLAKLEIVKCEELTVSIANYKQLRQLNIDGCKVLEHTAAKVEFELLESLCISNISEVMSRPTGELFRKGLSKVRDLKINGCEKLTSSLKNEARLLQWLTSLGRLEIEDNSRLVEELGEEAEELLQLQILDCKLEFLKLRKCENLLKLPKGLNQLSSLQELRIHECSSLVSFTDVGLPPSLKDILITECDSLIYFAKFQIPQNLRRIEIRKCKILKSLVDEEAVGSSWSSSSHSCLEYLKIEGCESLTSLSLSGQLLRTLKHLEILGCEQLELIAEDRFFHDNTNYCLEYIMIWNCQNLKSLPDGLCHLSNLQQLYIFICGSLVSIPRLSGGRRPSNLREIYIRGCDKLEALREDMHNLNSLEYLSIDYREGLTFPPNLTSLAIGKVKSCKSLWELEWGLHRLTSLTYLYIDSDDPNTVSFPPVMVRMETLKFLAHLIIKGFPNLKKLSSKGFQFLPSLQSLKLSYCPKLASIPEEGLPPSLTKLWIYECPVLKERCQPGKGRYWHKISHIPCIQIDGTLI
ncbi:putative disease resistance RPP13-like protein 1 [Malus sylvestris]|uniref:putative disease resistance RPP13-like protein 1 n=1 Tax=Malus sylvestris TaxID=3752 RepID=UPI0021ACF148|nr:putative disease resistance RPP13-like protein 1 [Malus sylvestris]XP_050112974.1 putative disease resistance RPP13-like protein 1 [Malus sylvestris]XP_050112976.1 putative disease resistance RPP13-like protein 1 [Malus sylvestris]